MIVVRINQDLVVAESLDDALHAYRTQHLAEILEDELKWDAPSGTARMAAALEDWSDKIGNVIPIHSVEVLGDCYDKDDAWRAASKPVVQAQAKIRKGA